MTPELTAELLKRLDALAAKMGVTGQYLWGVLLRQAHVAVWEAVGGLLLGAIAIIVGLLALWWGIRQPKDKYDCLGDGALGAVVCGSISFVLGSIASLVNAFSLPTLLMNPGYWALQDLIRQLKGH